MLLAFPAVALQPFNVPKSPWCRVTESAGRREWQGQTPRHSGLPPPPRRGDRRASEDGGKPPSCPRGCCPRGVPATNSRSGAWAPPARGPCRPGLAHLRARHHRSARRPRPRAGDTSSSAAPAAKAPAAGPAVSPAGGAPQGNDRRGSAGGWARASPAPALAPPSHRAPRPHLSARRRFPGPAGLGGRSPATGGQGGPDSGARSGPWRPEDPAAPPEDRERPRRAPGAAAPPSLRGPRPRPAGLAGLRTRRRVGTFATGGTVVPHVPLPSRWVLASSPPSTHGRDTPSPPADPSAGEARAPLTVTWVREALGFPVNKATQVKGLESAKYFI